MEEMDLDKDGRVSYAEFVIKWRISWHGWEEVFDSRQALGPCIILNKLDLWVLMEIYNIY